MIKMKNFLKNKAKARTLFTNLPVFDGKREKRTENVIAPVEGDLIKQVCEAS